MAFQFVPNADGSFDEGMRQTNPETGVEYIFTDGAWRPLGPSISDQFDELDERYVKTEGSSRFKGDLYLDPPNNGTTRWRVMEGNTPHSFQVTSHPYIGGQLTDSKIHITVKNTEDINGDQVPQTIINYVPDPVQSHQAVNKAYVDDEFLPLTGGTLTGDLTLKGSKDFFITKDDDSKQFQIKANSSDYFTNIYGFSEGGIGGLRFRVSSDQDTAGTYGTGISISQETHVVGDKTYAWTTQLNYLRTPTDPGHGANKQYVDDKVASSGGGVPVGSIMIWLQSTPPPGWFKCQGKTFDINQYPLLHAYLQTTAGYSSGRLPDWSGRYPGEYGDHLSGTLGTFANPRTAKPNAGAPYSGSTFNNGGTSTANKAGGTNFASTRVSQVEINQGWDSTTRPKTVVVHYIIKHD